MSVEQSFRAMGYYLVGEGSSLPVCVRRSFQVPRIIIRAWVRTTAVCPRECAWARVVTLAPMGCWGTSLCRGAGGETGKGDSVEAESSIRLVLSENAEQLPRGDTVDSPTGENKENRLPGTVRSL